MDGTEPGGVQPAGDIAGDELARRLAVEVGARHMGVSLKDADTCPVCCDEWAYGSTQWESGTIYQKATCECGVEIVFAYQLDRIAVDHLRDDIEVSSDFFVLPRPDDPVVVALRDLVAGNYGQPKGVHVAALDAAREALRAHGIDPA